MTAAAVYFSALLPGDSQALARGLRRRDPDLLDQLIEQYQFRLYRYLLYLTGNAATAEDLHQETWIRVLERGHQYDGQSKFETWLFAIARHLVIDLGRRQRPDDLDSLAEEPRAGGVSAFEQVASQETAAQIEAWLSRVPAVYREVLVLRFQEELALEEISVILGTPLSTVKSRLYRGLDALRGLQPGERA